MRLQLLKPLPLAVSIAGVLLWARAPDAQGQAACPVTVLASVTVPAGEFSLADLLVPGSCPALRRAAAEVRLGSAPLAGSVRVLAGSEVRNALQTMAGSADPKGGAFPAAWAAGRIPERITVRRAGARASCLEIGAQVPLSHAPISQASMSQAPISEASESSAMRADRAIECGAGGGILRAAQIEFARPVWDPTLVGWDVRARCLHPADCVPFLVRVRGPAAAARAESWRAAGMQPPAGSGDPVPGSLVRGAPVRGSLVRPGQKVTLLWDQDGIRVVVPALAIDAGGPGEPVRARIVGAPGLIHAWVVGAGELRVAP